MLKHIVMYIKGKNHYVQCKAVPWTDRTQQAQVCRYSWRRPDHFPACQTPEIATTEEISSVNYGEAFEVKHVN